MEPAALDLVIPVYNEGEHIRTTLEALRAHVRTPYRVLVCYDHDEDTTLQALRGYDAQGVTIHPVKNPGRGAHAAVQAGFAASMAAAVIVYPADDDYNAGILDQMYAALRDGADIVTANRFIPGGCMCGCPWLKAICIRVSAFVLHHIVRVPTADPSNGFRLFSRRVLSTIRVESTVGFTYSIELLMKVHRLRWRIADVPAQWYERRHGTSRFRVLRWLPAYLQWVGYACGTTFLRRRPDTVPVLEH